MKKAGMFLLGLVLGLTIGSVAHAWAADGYLIGWEVTKEGNTICWDPWIWQRTKEIECD